MYYIILYYIIFFYIKLYYIILYYTIQYYTILYNTIQYYTILYNTIQYYTILYKTILYYTILYYTLHYITLHYITYIYTYTYINILGLPTIVGWQLARISYCWCVMPIIYSEKNHGIYLLLLIKSPVNIMILCEIIRPLQTSHHKNKHFGIPLVFICFIYMHVVIYIYYIVYHIAEYIPVTSKKRRKAMIYPLHSHC